MQIHVLFLIKEWIFYKKIYICYFVSFQNVQQIHLIMIIKIIVIMQTIPNAIKQMCLGAKWEKEYTEKNWQKCKKKIFKHLFSYRNHQ